MASIQLNLLESFSGGLVEGDDVVLLDLEDEGDEEVELLQKEFELHAGVPKAVLIFSSGFCKIQRKITYF